MAQFSLKPSKTGLIVLVVIAVMGFLGLMSAYFLGSTILNNSVALLKKEQKEVAEANSIVQKAEKAKLEFLDAKSQVRNLETSISTSEYIPTMLKQLEGLGKSVKMKVVSVRPDNSKPVVTTRTMSSGAQAANGNVDAASSSSSGNSQTETVPIPKPYDEQKIDIELSGNYMNALDFVYKLTCFPKIVSVNKIDISEAKESDSTSDRTVSVKINLTAYIYKEAEISGEPAVKPASAMSGVTVGGKAS